jgi:hypothetical protein
VLTAAAASLGLVPIAREVFWGPMAYAMMGGIIAGTLLTLLFLPALYVAWFRIKNPAAGPTGPAAAANTGGHHVGLPGLFLPLPGMSPAPVP